MLPCCVACMRWLVTRCSTPRTVAAAAAAAAAAVVAAERVVHRGPVLAMLVVLANLVVLATRARLLAPLQQ